MPPVDDRIVPDMGQVLRSGGFHPVLAVGWAALLAGAAAWGWLRRDGPVPDQVLFARSGGAVLAGHWSQVYADPQVQAGPWELVLVHLLHLGGRTVAEGSTAGLLPTLTLPLLVAAAGLGVRLLRHCAGLMPSRWLELVVAFLVIGWGVGATIGWSGHLAALVVPVGWLLAALAARRGRPVLAGVLLGLAAGWETWAVLAAGLLLLDPVATGIRRLVRAGLGLAALGGVGLATYLPFALTGQFRMFEKSWPVGSGTLPHLIGLGEVGFPWSARLAQALLAVLAGAAVAAGLRGRWEGVWLAPLAACCVRLLLDPVLYGYYWTPPLLLALAGVASLRPEGRFRFVVPAMAFWLSVDAGSGWVGTALVTLPVCVLATLLARDRAGPVQAATQRTPVVLP